VTLGTAGKLHVAVAATKSIPLSDGTADTAHLTWFGSAEAFTDKYAEATSGGNYYFFGATASFMSEPFISAYEELAADGGIAIGKATYRHSGDTWTVYILCESNTASVLVIDPHDEGDYVIAFTDAIAKSYRVRTAG
jgi:hypothetical protein